MNRFENWIFVIAILCYIWDWYDFIYLGDRDGLLYFAIACLSIYFIFEIPNRILMYKTFGTIWY